MCRAYSVRVIRRLQGLKHCGFAVKSGIERYSIRGSPLNFKQKLVPRGYGAVYCLPTLKRELKLAEIRCVRSRAPGKMCARVPTMSAPRLTDEMRRKIPRTGYALARVTSIMIVASRTLQLSRIPLPGKRELLPRFPRFPGHFISR